MKSKQESLHGNYEKAKEFAKIERDLVISKKLVVFCYVVPLFDIGGDNKVI